MPKRKMAQASLDNLLPGGTYKFTREDKSKGGKESQRRRSAQEAAQRLRRSEKSAYSLPG